MAVVQQLMGGKKKHRLIARLDEALVAAAKARTGIKSSRHTRWRPLPSATITENGCSPRRGSWIDRLNSIFDLDAALRHIRPDRRRRRLAVRTPVTVLPDDVDPLTVGPVLLPHVRWLVR
jgi:hypothetical protein